MKNSVCYAIAMTWLTLHAALAQSELSSPSVSLSVNGQETVQAYRGRPLLARVEIFNEALMRNTATTNVQLISGGSNAWTAAVQLEIVDSTGTAIDPVLLPANSATGTLTLTAELGGEVGWWLTPEATTNLAPGVYTLRAVLNTTNASEGWQGLSRSRAVTVILGHEPASLAPELVAEKFLRATDYAVWSGEFARANSLIDQLLSLQSTNVTALTRKGDLLAFMGQDRHALEFYQFALQACSLRHSDPDAEPPEALLKRHNALLAKVAFATDAGHLSLSVLRSAQGHVSLQWPAVPGRAYTLEGTTDLTNWHIAAAGLVAETNRMTWTTNCAGPARFYRVATASE